MASTSTQFLPSHIDVGGSTYPAAEGTSTTLPTYSSDNFSARRLMSSNAMTTTITGTAARASLEVCYSHLDSAHRHLSASVSLRETPEGPHTSGRHHFRSGSTILSEVLPLLARFINPCAQKDVSPTGRCRRCRLYVWD